MIQRVRAVLWFCAGVDASLAKKLTTEHTMLSSVGATVLLTAVLAFLFGSYAFHLVFRSWIQAVGLGLLWAVIIFNLDRFMVSSIRKQGMLLEDLSKAIPRILMALLIAIVLIVPIELRLFESEIDDKLHEHVIAQQRPVVEAIQKGALQSQIRELDAGIEEIKQELGALERQRMERLEDPEGRELRETLVHLNARIEKLKKHKRLASSKEAEFERQATEEDEGTGGTRIPGKGPHHRTYKAKAEEQRKMIGQLYMAS